MQNHSSTPKTSFTLGLEWLCHIFSPYNSFKVARGFRIELYYTVNVLYSECIIQRIYYTAAAPWMAPFKIEELIIHKKFSMKGRDSKVVQNSNININRFENQAQGRMTERNDYDIALLRLDYPIMDEGTGITVLEV